MASLSGAAMAAPSAALAASVAAAQREAEDAVPWRFWLWGLGKPVDNTRKTRGKYAGLMGKTIGTL